MKSGGREASSFVAVRVMNEISADTLARAVAAALAEWERSLNELPDEDDVDETRVMERVVLVALAVLRPEIERAATERAACAANTVRAPADHVP